MGRQAREIRKRLKAEAKKFEALGWYETEYGELKKRVSKSEARKVFLLNCRKAQARVRVRNVPWIIDFDSAKWALEAERDVVSAMNERVKVEMDELVFSELSLIGLQGKPPEVEMR